MNTEAVEKAALEIAKYSLSDADVTVERTVLSGVETDNRVIFNVTCIDSKRNQTITIQVRAEFVIQSAEVIF